MRSRTFLILAAGLALGAPRARAASSVPHAEVRPSASASATAHYLRARIALAAGDMVAARRELEVALGFEPESPELRLAQAELLFRLGQPARAEAEGRRALAGAPPAATRIRGKLVLGRAAAARGHWLQAAAELRIAADLEAGEARRAGRAPDPAPWRVLSAVLALGGDAPAAAVALEDLAVFLPGPAAEGYLDLAAAAEPRDRIRAETLLRRASALAPSDPRALRRLARLDEERGRVADARASWQAALRAEPDDADALLALGRLAALEGDVAGARAFFQQLAASDADPLATDAEIGLAWLEAGNGGEALPLLERAVAGRPREVGLRYALGAAAERAGDLDRAVTEMRALLAISPDDPDALNFVAYSYAERGERLDEAEEMLGRALAKSPASPAYLDSLGWVYFRKGDVARAVATLERAVGADEDATILEHLGDAYGRAGRKSAAAEAYRRALRALAAPGAATRGPAEGERRSSQRAALEEKLATVLSLRAPT